MSTHHSVKKTLTPSAIEPQPLESHAHVMALYRRHLSRGRAKLSDVFGTQLELCSKGAWVTTSDGEHYLNAGGYGVFIHGARHPHVEAAVIEQIQTSPLSSRILLEPQAALAAAALARILPKGLAHVHFAGSGTEATEAAIKLARMCGKMRLITTEKGYHGKTMGALSVTANTLYQAPFEPLLSHVETVPFGDTEALEQSLKNGPQACVILEPIQGEGGVRIPPSGYLQKVRSLCLTYDALMVLDEIQTGMGRVGHWWAADREGVAPDILLAGKGLSGGIVPVSAMAASPKVFEPFSKDPFIHTSTFSCAPIAMAAARAAVEAIEHDGLIERANTLGTYLLEHMQNSVNTHCPHLVDEVRGVGLLIGVEMKAPGLAGALLAELIDQHLIVNYSLNASRVLRFTPPAIMTLDEVEFLLHAFENACRSMAHQYPTANTIGAH